MHPLSIVLVAMLLGAGGSEAQAAQSASWAGPPAPPASPVAPPAPPAPPPLPEIPAEAHTACAGKASGSQLSFTPGPGETMNGLCERVDGRMVFQLRSYRSTQ